MDFNTELRKMGYVNSGLSGVRGDYIIESYRPGAKKKHQLPSGLVEVHFCERMKVNYLQTVKGIFNTVSEAVDSLR